MVGTAVGILVGWKLGVAVVGFAERTNDGTTVGTALGTALGAIVGIAEGTAVGGRDGTGVG